MQSNNPAGVFAPRGLGRVLEACQRLANALGATLFIALFVVFVIQIGARFAFNRPMPWTDELAVILYTWIVLWGCTALVPWQGHVAFDSAVDAMPKRVGRLMLGLQWIAVAALVTWAIPACWDYVQFMQREATPVLGWSYRWVFMPFVVMLVSIVLRCAWQFASLARAKA